jgi:hypothetical protein
MVCRPRFRGRHLERNHWIYAQSPLAQLQSCQPMATQAKGANIFQIAFPSAFHDGNNVIGIPEALARFATQAPVCKKRIAICAARVTKPACLGNGVDSARGADTAITMEDLFPEICGLRPQLPLVHTELGTEGVASTRDLKRAPAAHTASVGAARNCLAINPAAPHGA